jgi:hypothetical protein
MLKPDVLGIEQYHQIFRLSSMVSVPSLSNAYSRTAVPADCCHLSHRFRDFGAQQHGFMTSMQARIFTPPVDWIT